MAELDQEYLNTRKATDTWQAQTLTQLTSGAEGTGTPTDPATELRIDANTAPGNDAAMNGEHFVTDLKLAKPPTEGTPGEPVKGEAIVPAQQSGESQPFEPSVMHGDQAQPQGRFTVTDPRINSGQPTPFDSLKDAQKAAGTPDPLAKIEETVGVSPLEGVLKTAEQKDAAKNFVDLLNIPVEHLAGFITKGDVTQTATPDELGAQILAPVVGKLGELLDEKQLGMLTTVTGILGMIAIDPMNPALAITGTAKAAGKASKLAVEPKKMDPKRTRTVTEDVRGTQKTYEERNFPVRAKVRVEWDDMLLPAPESEGGIKRGFDTIDDEIDGLNIGHILRRAADNWDNASRIQIIGIVPPKNGPLKKAIDLLKSERGSFQPVPGSTNPYGSSYSTKKQAGASKTPLEPTVSTQVTWEEAVKIDEHQRAFNDGLKTFDERLHTQRGGVQSDVNVFAESIGPDALKMEEFLNLPPGTILKTSDIAAAKRLFTDLTEPARLLAKWLKKNPNDQQAFLALLERLPQIDAGLTKIAGVFAEPGRLQRMLALDKPVTGMVKADTPERVRISQPYIKQWLDFFQQQQELAAMGAPAMTQENMVKLLSQMKSQEEILYAAKVLAKPSWWDMFTEVWINGLLSGPVTHTTNILSNTATLLWNIPERAVASALSGGAVRPGEAQAMLGGVVESLGDAWALAVKAFKEDETQLGLGKIETPRRAITADALELTGVPGRAVDYLGTVVRLPGRFLMAGDDFFKSIAFRAELRALAKREAFNQINEAGLSGAAAVNKAKEIEAKILANPTQFKDIHDAAQEFAAYTTFTRELGETGQKVQALAGTPIGRLVLPFVRTPTNIFKFAGERTPLALASRAVRDEIAAGGPRRALALAKISLGSMTMGYIATLAANGLVTGNGPKDPALRELKKATGWQPNSFKIGDTYVSYSRLEPIGSLFGMAADAADIMGQLDEMDAEELASALTVAFARNASSKTFIKGLAETLHAVTSQDVNVVNHYLEKEIPTLIPFSSLLKQTRNVVDPVMREVDTVLEAFKNKVPGFSTDLPPHRNLWGEQVIMEGGLGPDFLSPLYTSSVKDDPVSAEIVRLGVPVRKPAKSIDGVPLSPWQYDAYVLLSGGKPIMPDGMTLKEKLADLMGGPLYDRSSDGPDGGKATLIREIISGYRDRAKYILSRPDLSQEYLDKDFPDLRDSLNAAQVQERQKFNAPTTAPGGLTR